MTPEPRTARDRARYSRIASELTAEISGGRFAVGQRFLSEADIAARFDVSRHTAREALRVIEEAGLIARRQGAGSFVRAHKAPAAFRHHVQTVDDLLQYGMTARLVIERAERTRADAALGRRLEITRGAPLVHLSGARYGDGGSDLVGLMDAYVLPRTGVDVAPLLDPLDAAHALRALVDVRRLSRVEQTFSATLLDEAQAARLGGPPGASGMIAERRYYDPEGRLLVLAVSVHRGDKFRYTSVLTREAL